MIHKIAETLHKHSKRKAFYIGGEEYTYEMMAARIAGIMYMINDKIPQVGKCKCIGIVERDDIETYASLLAVLMSGNAYVILNPANPVSRNISIAETTDMEMVLYSQDDSLIQQLTATKICMQTVGCQGDPKDVKVKEVDGNELAYIIFTSGSTGVPKGVPISRDNLNAFYKAYENLGFQLDENDRMLQMFDLCFDVSVVSTLYPLTLGACVYTVAQNGVKYTQVYELLEDEELTFATMPPSLLSYLQPYFEEIDLPHLKYLGLTAEASNWSLISQFVPSIPNAQIINLYGPSESTIYCMASNVIPDSVKEYNDMLAIGQPFEGMDMIIVDDSLKEVSRGEKGELCIAGPQLMRGYWKDEHKSREVFFEHDKKRFYRTGDLCFMDEQECVLYCGRKDYQVQVQGFRVELSECENAVRRFHKSGANVVVASPNRLGNLELHLFVEKFMGQLEQLQEFLRENLPPYMCPSKVHRVEALPLNASGKVDRKKLINLL